MLNICIPKRKKNLQQELLERPILLCLGTEKNKGSGGKNGSGGGVWEGIFQVLFCLLVILLKKKVFVSSNFLRIFSFEGLESV